MQRMSSARLPAAAFVLAGLGAASGCAHEEKAPAMTYHVSGQSSGAPPVPPVSGTSLDRLPLNQARQMLNDPHVPENQKRLLRARLGQASL